MAKQKQKSKIDSNIKTEWDLTLLYKNENDPQLNADIKTAETAYDSFAKKYREQTDYLENEESLKNALEDYEKLYTLLDTKAYLYLMYRISLDTQNTEIGAKLNILTETLNKHANKIVFFDVALSKIPETKQATFLNSETLKPYRYFLKRKFEKGKHTLTEAEEKILNLTGLPSYMLWVKGNETILGKQVVIWKKKKMPLSEALNKITTLKTKERRALSTIVYEKLKEVSDFAENEMNAIVIDKKISDELRGYKTPFDETIRAYHNEPETVKNLIETVTRHFPIAHRFYKLKAKLLGEKTLVYADRGAEIGKTNKKISFDDAVGIVKRGFSKVHPDYADIFSSMLSNGQIDVYPHQGKESGAFCSGHKDLPTFVLLNQVNSFDSVTTMAHEMGHAIHSELSNQHQRPLYSSYSTAVAETASTFFENFVFDEIFETLTKKEQIVALHDRITDSIQTVFRQIACFNFELDLHTQIREKGSISKEDLLSLMNKHMQAYLGPVFKLIPLDGYMFVAWSHLRRFFYVYSYAFGKIISTALYEMYKNDPKTETKIRQFLSAGGSASPEDIFASIGIDIRKPEFFELGLKKIESDIEELEKLTSSK